VARWKFARLKNFPRTSDLIPVSDREDVPQVVDHLFRRESGRLVAILTRRFGAENLHLAEDVVQDALVKAMETWPYTGVPPNPTAWVLHTARNRALDHTRRVQIWRGKQDQFAPLVEDCLESALNLPAPRFEEEIRDSQLRMMLVCGHPGLPPESQVALMLKTLCGFGDREIAAAFLGTEHAIAKRLMRAREFLREANVSVELPPGAEFESRVGSVRHALYLLFNEGYKASHGDTLLREDLCAEATRLGELLALHPLGDHPTTHALLALMYFNAARLSSRANEAGHILLLAEQDRSRWDNRGIQRGMLHLAASGVGREVSRYHLEAGIAASHCLAPDYASTNWPHILALYNQLGAIDRSPVISLNRAVALARVEGPRAGLEAIERMPGRSRLKNYHLLHAVSGALWLEAGEAEKAVASLRRAHELATLEVERTLLANRLAQADALVKRLDKMHAVKQPSES
jgi:RNA polymerase sigma factor (sigma-70 family)